MTDEHVELVKAHEEHNKKGGGCIVYCTGDYDEGNPHSHRFNAAKRARAEGPPYSNYSNDPFEVATWDLSKLKDYERWGGLATPIDESGPRPKASVKPYSVTFHPFKHQAHHIIPSENLEIALGKVAKKGKDRANEVKSFVLGAILKEPYNNNDEPNMIILPSSPEDSVATGLPKHLGSHPDYSRMVYMKVIRKFNATYSGVAEAIGAMQHLEDADVPPIKPELLPISNGIYNAILSVARGGNVGGTPINQITDMLRKAYKPGSAQ